jgi:tryptophan halogenase
MPLPVDPEMAPYTRASALDAGWAWRIPLSHRVGCGYVHASAFTSRDDALRTLLAHASPPAGHAEPRELRMRVGRRTRFWVKNCLSVGLSAGFLEPLESTGIFLIQSGIELLLEHFPDRHFDDALLAQYNARMSAVYDEVRDFIVLHYVLSAREDTPFWKAARAVPLPDSLRATLELYERTGVVSWLHNALFGVTSFHAIAAGLERLPVRAFPATGWSDAEKAWEILGRIRAQNEELAASLPGQGEFVRALHARRGGPAS